MSKYRDLWKSDLNYGNNLVLEGVIARVTPNMRTGYTASVRMKDAPQIDHSGFKTFGEATEWAEQYLDIYLENVRLRERLKLLDGWFKHYTAEYHKLKHEQDTEEWQEDYKRIKAALAEALIP